MTSIVTCYYNSWEALMWQKKKLLKSGLDIVVVDDCSPEPLKIDWANVYRIKEDIFFNLDAVNLSVLKAKGEKVFRFDLDHTTDFEELDKIDIPQKTIFHFNRKCGGKELLPNQSHIFLKKKDFIEIGGWNTVYSGNYGMCDNDFVRRAKKMGYVFEIAPIILEANLSLYTKGISRDPSVNRIIYNSNPECKTNWNINYETINILR
jgi:hypothetical protein